MKDYLFILAEELNDLTNEKHIIRIGRHDDLNNKPETLEKLNGELFIMTGYGKNFRIVSDDSSKSWDIDKFSYYSKITLIKDLKENISISYDEVDVSNKTSLRRYFPNDKIGTEMFEYVQSVPVRFRQDALNLFCDADDRDMWIMKTVNKAWCYFLDEIVQEMTKEEKQQYGF